MFAVNYIKLFDNDNQKLDLFYPQLLPSPPNKYYFNFVVTVNLISVYKFKMDEIKLLLIGIIFSLAQFDLVKAGPESQVFSDLINLHFDEKMEWKNCLIVTLDLKQEMALQIVSSIKS